MQLPGCDWYPLKLDAIAETHALLFSGGVEGLHMLLRALNSFLQSPFTEFMAVVSEMYDRHGNEARTSKSSWLLAKFGEPMELCLLRVGNPSPCNLVQIIVSKSNASITGAITMYMISG